MQGRVALELGGLFYKHHQTLFSGAAEESFVYLNSATMADVNNMLSGELVTALHCYRYDEKPSIIVLRKPH